MACQHQTCHGGNPGQGSGDGAAAGRRFFGGNGSLGQLLAEQDGVVVNAPCPQFPPHNAGEVTTAGLGNVRDAELGGGVITMALPGWSLGTYFGVVMGNVLPANVVSALSVGLYGMFLAIIIPPARKSRVIAALVVNSIIPGGFTFSFVENTIRRFRGKEEQN